MILISLMLAATPAPALRPDQVPRRQIARSHPAARATRSQRLTELEAAVRSLAPAAAEQVRDVGPKGM
jgi:hypothetical protein